MKASIIRKLPDAPEPTRAAYKKPVIYNSSKHLRVVELPCVYKPNKTINKPQKHLADKPKQRKKRESPVWTDEKLKYLIQYWNEGMMVQDISECLGTSYASTATMIQRMQEEGRIAVRYEQRPYSDEDDQVIVANRRKGLSYDKIGLLLGRSGSSIGARVRRLQKTGVKGI